MTKAPSLKKYLWSVEGEKQELILVLIGKELLLFLRMFQ